MSAYGDIRNPLVCTITRLGPSAGPREAHGHPVDLGVHGVHALGPPQVVQRPEVPGAGRPQRDPAAAGAAQLPADDEQPGAEDRGGVGALHVLEEGRVDRAGGVVEGQEDDPAARPDRRGLGGHLHPGHQQLAAAARREQVDRPGDPEPVEEGGVEVDHVLAGVEAEDVQLGAHPVGVGHLRQAAHLLGRRAPRGRGRAAPRRPRPPPRPAATAAARGRGPCSPGRRPAGAGRGHRSPAAGRGGSPGGGDRCRWCRCRRRCRRRRPAPAARPPAGRPGRAARSRSARRTAHPRGPPRSG